MSILVQLAGGKELKDALNLADTEKSFEAMRLCPLKICNPTSLHGGSFNAFSHVKFWGEVFNSSPENFKYIFKESYHFL